MKGGRITFPALAALIFLGWIPLGVAQTRSVTARVIRQIDHVLVQSPHARELFALLTETFDLPVAWPLSDYGGFASGGVFLGNVNLEVIQSADPAATTAGRFTGFALEPEPLQASLPELDARAIPHGPAVPFRRSRFFGRVLWTTVALPTVSTEQVEIFLCEYDDDLPARRQRLQQQLRFRKGGALSVTGVREIVYGARDITQMAVQWRKLLDPLAAASPGLWKVGAGPAIRLRAADQDSIQEMVIAVESLTHARGFIKARGLLGADEPAGITVGGSALGGLRVMLVETSADAQ